MVMLITASHFPSADEMSSLLELRFVLGWSISSYFFRFYTLILYYLLKSVKSYAICVIYRLIAPEAFFQILY
jgi:hypothetical protein